MVSFLNFWEFERHRTTCSSFSTFESTFFSFFLLLTKKEEVGNKKKNSREISHVKKKQGLDERSNDR